MRFGVAKEMITPDFPMFMIGYAEYYKKTYRGVHDDLFVRCLLLDDGKRKAVLLAYDLLFHDHSLAQKVRRFAKDEFGVDEDAVVLSYTHTHYSVAVQGYASEEADERYETYLLEQSKRAIRKAFLNMSEGELSYISTTADESINRRKLVDGQYIMAPNQEGEKDMELNALVIRNKDNRVKAIAVNYSCHPNILRDLPVLSSEYPGRICQILESHFYGSYAFFFQGSGADTRARVTALYDRFVPRTYDDVDDMAKRLAGKIIRQIGMKKEKKENVELKYGTFCIPCPLDVKPKSYYEEDYKTDPFEAIRECARFVKDNYESLPETCDLHGGCLQISKDILVIYLGGEICYPTKKLLQQAFPDKRIYFLGYADSTAYVPSDKIIGEGGYEHEGSIIEYRLKGTFRPGIDKLMLKAVHNIVDRF